MLPSTLVKCDICRREVQSDLVSLKFCKHRFHKKCLQRYLKINADGRHCQCPELSCSFYFTRYLLHKSPFSDDILQVIFLQDPTNAREPEIRCSICQDILGASFARPAHCDHFFCQKHLTCAQMIETCCPGDKGPLDKVYIYRDLDFGGLPQSEVKTSSFAAKCALCEMSLGSDLVPFCAKCTKAHLRKRDFHDEERKPEMNDAFDEENA